MLWPCSAVPYCRTELTESLASGHVLIIGRSTLLHSHRNMCLLFSLSLYLPACLSVCMSLCKIYACLSLSLHVCLFVCLFLCLCHWSDPPYGLSIAPPAVGPACCSTLSSKDSGNWESSGPEDSHNQMCV